MDAARLKLWQLLVISFIKFRIALLDRQVLALILLIMHNSDTGDVIIFLYLNEVGNVANSFFTRIT